MKLLYLLTISGFAISFAISKIYEGRIKDHFRQEKITDNFDNQSLNHLSLFPFYLSDCEGKVKCLETQEQIKKYKFYLRITLGFAGALAITHMLNAILI
jgi:hypothetical protein